MRLVRSFKSALQGIGKAVSSQANMKIHVAALFAAVVAGFYFHITPMEWVAVLIAAGLVLSLELINTAIEELLDFIHPQHHQQVGRIKDIAAGAVLVVAIVAIVIAILIFWKYIVV